MSRAGSAARISIPITLFGVIVMVLVWLCTQALANERRITRCETTIEVLNEIRDDLKEIKAIQVQMRLDIQHLRDTKMDGVD